MVQLSKSGMSWAKRPRDGMDSLVGTTIVKAGVNLKGDVNWRDGANPDNFSSQTVK